MPYDILRHSSGTGVGDFIEVGFGCSDMDTVTGTLVLDGIHVLFGGLP
jgi:hypothetical protein